MDLNESLREQIFEIVKNQIQSNDPAETKETLDRLKKWDTIKTMLKKLIGQCVAVELYHVLLNQEPFNEPRYISNLKNFPEEPFN